VAAYSFDRRRWTTLAKPPSLSFVGAASIGDRYVLSSFDGFFVSDAGGKAWRPLLPAGSYTGVAVEKDGPTLYTVRAETNADIWEAALP
jgi:hypothetical protein